MPVEMRNVLTEKFPKTRRGLVYRNYSNKRHRRFNGADGSKVKNISRSK